MFSFTVIGLSIFGTRQRGAAAADDLDVALAGAQVGLEKKRQRWLLFLIEKEEQCLSRIAQTAEVDAIGDDTDEAQALRSLDSHYSYDETQGYDS